MSDGAHLGVSAGRAIGTILSGEPSPAQDERMSDAQFEQYIRTAPDEGAISGEEGYEHSARLCARLLLTYLEAHPEAQAWPLDVPIDWDRAKADDAFRDGDCAPASNLDIPWLAQMLQGGGARRTITNPHGAYRTRAYGTLPADVVGKG